MGSAPRVIWDQLESGADVNEVAQDFDLDGADVRWAYSYESSVRAA